MSAFYRSCSLFAFSLMTLYADAPLSLESFMEETLTEAHLPIEEIIAPELSTTFTPPPVQTQVATPKPKEIPFSPFTGKIKARNVRVRLGADVESRIIKELGKNELVTVVGQKEGFWMIEPPSGVKAYVFRSFILDDTVEGNRVNVRLQPNLEAPVIGHLNAGQKVKGVISALNQKWLEIDPPQETHFYVSKDYIEYAGGPDFKAQADKRNLAAEQLLDATALLAKAELRKPFEEIDSERVIKGYQTLLSDYSDFPEHVEQAQNALASFQEHYLQKRLSHFDATAPVVTHVKEEVVKAKQQEMMTDKMKMWEPVEQALFLSWSSHAEKSSMDDFYTDQALAAETLTGILEPYHSPVNGKPGDFIIRNQDVPVAYVYSTKVNLQNLVGKQVSLKVSSRPNNNFAFPAYYVLSTQEK